MSDQPTLHYASTRDGWRIALHHRPPPPGGHGTPVILCHGMGSNRFNMDGPGRTSLARHLNAAGFDVWGLELRGAGKSRRRLRMPPVPWSWTFEDHVQHDVPAALRLVRELTGHERLLWVGHSLGGMVAYASLMSPAAESFAGVVTLGSPSMTDVGHEVDRSLGSPAPAAASRAAADARQGARVLGAPFAGILATRWAGR